MNSLLPNSSDYWSQMDMLLDPQDPELSDFLALERDRAIDNQALQGGNHTDAPSQPGEEPTEQRGTKRQGETNVSAAAKKAKTFQDEFFTIESIRAFNASIVPFGEDKALPFELIANGIFPRLSLRAICNFIFIQKAFFGFLKDPAVLNQLFSNYKTQHLKLCWMVLPFLSSVNTLDLTNSPSSDNEMVAVLRNCSNLTSLNLQRSIKKSGATYYCKELTKRLLDAVSYHSSSLKSLNLNGWSHKRDSSAFQLCSEKSWTLTSFSLGDCHDVNDAAIQALLGNKEQLTHLSLKGCADEKFLKEAIPCTNLTTLKFTVYPAISKEIMQLLAQNLTNLKSLFLGVLSEEGSEILAQSFPNLNKLTCQGCDIPNVFMTRLLQSHANLTNLKLISCKGIGAAVRETSKNCENLIRLVINTKDSDPITDLDLSKLLPNCKNLTSIRLEACNQVTELTMMTLWQNCKNLAKLNLYECGNIKMIDLFRNLKPHPSLTKLYLNQNKSSVDTISDLIKNCPNLTELDLRGCTQITDENLPVLAHSIKNLKKIRLGAFWDEGLRSAGIEFLLKQREKPLKIYLIPSKVLTVACIKSLQKAYPYQIYLEDEYGRKWV